MLMRNPGDTVSYTVTDLEIADRPAPPPAGSGLALIRAADPPARAFPLSRPRRRRRTDPLHRPQAELEAFLGPAIQMGWDRPGVGRMTLATNSLDHPLALALYPKPGFVPVRRKEMTRKPTRARDG